VAAHAHGALGIKYAVLAGVDSIEHGSYINEEEIQLMKDHGTYLVPTVYLEHWLMENYKTLGFPTARAGLRHAACSAPARCGRRWGRR